MIRLMTFHWLQFCVNLEFEYYEEPALKIEKLYTEEVANLKKKIESESENLEEFDKAELFESYGNEFDLLYKKIPTIQRRSELVSAYSLFERNIIKICELLENKIDNPVKMRDLESKDYINKAILYLEKVVRVDFPRKNKIWKEVLIIQNVRNSIVHANAKIKIGNGNLVNYIRESEHLELTESCEIEIKEGFTKHSLSVFKGITDIIFSLLENKYGTGIKLVK